MYFAEKIYKVLNRVKARRFAKVGVSFGVSGPMRVSGWKYLTIGEAFQAGSGLQLLALDQYGADLFQPSICIGRRISAGRCLTLASINSIVIGDDTLIGGYVFITDHSHGRYDNLDILENKVAPIMRPLYSKGPVNIGRRCWIGERVSILPNVTIGDNCIIGANSVVVKNIPPNCIAAGNPARVFKVFCQIENKWERYSK